ncbi:ATP-binding protein [Mucilaginibacter sp. PAMB04274]|uniref:ATP-binding protein n=1 Tax=Mucilaginibacter sp. PAMB04274 TaxID=3138568 RepID=UPI0031F6B401
MKHKHAPVKLSRADSLRLEGYLAQSDRYQASQPDSAIYYAYAGLKYARQKKYLPGECRFYNRLAVINAQYGNLKLATTYQRLALNGYSALSNPKEIDNATSCLGILLARQGHHDQGKLMILHALANFKHNGQAAGMVKCYTRLGEVAELQGNLAEALIFYGNAEKLQPGQPLSDDYFTVLHSLGRVHTRLGDHNKAASYYEKGIEKSKDQRNLKAHLAFLHSAGIAWQAAGDVQKALVLHQKGLAMAKTSGLKEEEARSLIGMAAVIRNKDAGQGIRHLENALQIARSIGHRQLASEIYHSLSEIYRQQSRYKEALQTLGVHHRMVDSLKTMNAGHRIAVLQSSYELAESKLRLESLALEKQKSNEQRNEVIIAAICILLVLLVGIFYFIRTKRLNRDLENSNQIKDKLFSIIGHDLRNPIGGITQLLALMEEGGLSEHELRELISAMKKQGNVTLDILNALLNWGEAQLKGIHVKPVDVNAYDSIEKNRSALQQQAADKQVTVSNLAPENLRIFGDLTHFEFIVRNLLSNAIKFSHPGGKVIIDVKLSGHDAVLSVSDEGKGISAEQQAQFKKSGLDINYGTKGEKGTGIGLMLSKEFVQHNRGRLWLESEEGKGTTFYFSFPVAKIN